MNFTDQDMEIIQTTLKSRSQYLEDALKRLRNGKSNKDDRSALEQVMSEELARIGIDSDGEVNEQGVVIDEVLGKLGFKS
jgi:hypothetical protein